MLPSAPIVLTLSYVAAVVSLALGRLTLGQVAVTIALELLVAVHYASRRVAHAEGAVAHVDPLYEPSNGVRPVAGETLAPDDRTRVGEHERKGLSVICAVAALAMAIGAGDALVTTWMDMLAWGTITAGFVFGERQRFVGWLDSDAPATADPLTQTRHVTYRVMAFAGVLLFGASILNASSTTGALVLLGTAWAVDLAQEMGGRRGNRETAPEQSQPQAPGQTEHPEP